MLLATGTLVLGFTEMFLLKILLFGSAEKFLFTTTTLPHPEIDIRK